MSKPQLPTRQMTLGGQVYTIVFGFKAVAALEDAYDMSVAKIGKRFAPKAVRDDDGQLVLVPATDDKGALIPGAAPVPKFESDMRVVDIQRVMWAGFREHHPEITQDGVLDLLEQELARAGGLDRVLSETFAAWNASGEEAPKGDANPQ